MTIFKSLSAVSLASVLMLTAPVITTSAHAYQCKNYPTQSVGLANLRMAARAKSRQNWTNSVKSQFGLPWSVWNISNNKSISCSKLDAQWRCLASAAPCLYVVQ